ncbi:MAG: hypothetical protein DLM59_08215 [Pseudonocardiales bacterium]|nr:MAG: hypothetical protein DLM59_08215 [Pseudonocardiales bacterium]
MTWTRPARYAGTAAVAGIAALASYGHQRGVALAHGESHLIAALLPLSVDGMMAVAAVVMLDDRRAGRPTTGWAWAGFLAGILASLAANISHADPDLIARAVAAWPPLALVVTVEMLARGKAHPPTDEAPTVPAEATPAESQPAETAAQPPEPARPAHRTGLRPVAPRRRGSIPGRVLAELAALDRMPGARVDEIARRYDLTERTVRRAVQRHREAGPQAGRQLHVGVSVEAAAATIQGQHLQEVQT